MRPFGYHRRLKDGRVRIRRRSSCERLRRSWSWPLIKFIPPVLHRVASGSTTNGGSASDGEVVTPTTSRSWITTEVRR